MALTESVREIARAVCDNPEHVTIDEKAIQKTATELRNSPLRRWSEESRTMTHDEKVKVILLELTAGAVNYCYWYGRHNVRPCGASSNTMYKLLMKAASNFSCWCIPLVETFYKELVWHRFPMLKERHDHLQELIAGWSRAQQFAEMVIIDGGAKSDFIDEILEYLVSSFTGYASDVFLKRAQLLLHQIHRKTGLLDTSRCTVPADYQVPRILHHKRCLIYSQELDDRIACQEPISKGSVYEVEIRAATIMACDAIANAAESTPLAVDNFLWQSRKECTSPFHLTVTTDY